MGSPSQLALKPNCLVFPEATRMHRQGQAGIGECGNPHMGIKIISLQKKYRSNIQFLYRLTNSFLLGIAHHALRYLPMFTNISIARLYLQSFHFKERNSWLKGRR
jgi:hypothetical protein